MSSDAGQGQGMYGEDNQDEGMDQKPAADADRVPRDRGWAWMIVVATFTVNFLTIGVAKSMGVLFVEFQEKFSGTHSSAIGWLLAIHASLGMMLSPFTMALAMRFSNRTVVMFGGFLLSLGYLLSVFAPNARFLIFSYGVVSGIGFAMSYAPTLVMVSLYFRKRRATANGISFAGNGIGSFALPPLLRVVTDYYALFGALLFLSGLVLNVVVCGALLRPFTFYLTKVKKVIIKDTKGSITKKNRQKEAGSKEEEPSISLLHKNNQNQNEHVELKTEQVTNHQQSSSKLFLLHHIADKLCFLPSKPGEERKLIFDISLLKNKLFLVYLGSIALSSAGYPTVFIVLPPYANELQFSKTKGAFLVSVVGICDLFGRVFLGIVADFKSVKKIYMYIGTMFLTSLAAVGIGFVRNYFGIAVLCGIFGFLGGSFLSLTPVILVEALGEPRLPRALGFAAMTQGMAFLITMPLAGMIKDQTGRWDISLFVSAALLMAGALIMFLRPQPVRPASQAPSADILTNKTA